MSGLILPRLALPKPKRLWWPWLNMGHLMESPGGGHLARTSTGHLARCGDACSAVCDIDELILAFSGGCDTDGTTDWDGTYTSFTGVGDCGYQATVLGAGNPFGCGGVPFEAANAAVACAGPLTTGGADNERAYVAANGVLLLQITASTTEDKLTITITLLHDYVLHSDVALYCVEFDASVAQDLGTQWVYESTGTGSGMTSVSTNAFSPSGWSGWSGVTLDSISLTTLPC